MFSKKSKGDKKEKKSDLTTSKEPLSRKSLDAVTASRKSKDGRKSVDDPPRRKSVDAAKASSSSRKSSPPSKKSLTKDADGSSPMVRPNRKSSQPPPVLPDVPEGTYSTYDLKPTDTLEGVALRFNVSVDDLTKLNGMTSAASIYNHKTLRVPNSAESRKTNVAAGGKPKSKEPKEPKEQPKESKVPKKPKEEDAQASSPGGELTASKDIDLGSSWVKMDDGKEREAILEPFEFDDEHVSASADHLDEVRRLRASTSMDVNEKVAPEVDNDGKRRHRAYLDDTVVPLQESASYNWLREHDEVWENIQLPATHLEARASLKFLIRRGIPDALRVQVWKLVSGCTDFMQAKPGFYEGCLEKTFGGDIPEKFLFVPTFGGQIRGGDHYLTPKGFVAVQRILCTLASNHSDIVFMPVVPDLVCLLVTFLSEAETYCTVHCMTVQSRKAKEHIQYFLATKKEVDLFLYTFEDILAKRDAKLAAKMEELEITSHDFADDWFMTLFLNAFPYQACLRFFDAFLCEGNKILYRIALAHLKLHKARLLSASSKEEFLGVVEQTAAQVDDPSTMLKKAFELQLQRKEFHRYNDKNRAKVVHIDEPTIPVYYKPIIKDKSIIISDMQFELLYTLLPHRYTIADPVKLYSSDQEGYSLARFMEVMSHIPPKQSSPTIFIVKSTLGEVFGAFLGAHCPWQFSQGHSYSGERDCFLWTFVPEPAKYGWYEGNKDFFFRVDRHEGVFIGGGEGSGLQLDKDMSNGITQKCETFHNKPLTADRREAFEVSNFEVYGFM